MLLLHLSDIHFKEKELYRPDDPNLALRDDLIEDVRKMCVEIGCNVDHILLTGDIANFGIENEYNFAFDWLTNKLTSSHRRVC